MAEQMHRDDNERIVYYDLDVTSKKRNAMMMMSSHTDAVKNANSLSSNSATTPLPIPTILEHPKPIFHQQLVQLGI